jgi:hypothetical protein
MNNQTKATPFDNYLSLIDIAISAVGDAMEEADLADWWIMMEAKRHLREAKLSTIDAEETRRRREVAPSVFFSHELPA